MGKSRPILLGALEWVKTMRVDKQILLEKITLRTSVVGMLNRLQMGGVNDDLGSKKTILLG